MRLIDADALIEDVRKNSVSYFADDFAREWVDKQPTVMPSAEPTEEQVMDYCHRRCLVLVTSDLYGEMQKRWSAEPQRKKGKWLHLLEEDTYQCSECLMTERSGGYYCYCPNCGADMRGEADD